ncbi:indoleamine 2,3-dioxygenase [Haladaptatus salinisoli]|uniref:indoleamine 2,3-dioxygenase n=1 Tax=Haladaptatus salinisoli TaxID=2884876 RepID=UPI001D0A5AA4|nr:indoleamine 2,3-dioxygenase [Haladaptatus salinisoli]
MTERAESLDYDRFDISPDHGFLPDTEPLTSFGKTTRSHLQSLDELGENLPRLLEDDRLRTAVEDLEAPAPRVFDALTERELMRVYSVSGFLANAYVQKPDAPTAEAIPAGVAVPLYESTKRLGCTPVLSYDAYVLHNWTRIDADGAMTPPNIDSITNFFEPRDERWFIAIHVAIESAAGPAIAAIGEAQQGILEDAPKRVKRALRTIDDALRDITDTLDRMPERNDPERYGRGFRPYLKSLTSVEYEGVAELDGPRSYRGASGAQSSLFQAFDAALGIDHGDNPLVSHLNVLRGDMPPGHRAFIEAVEDGPNVRDYAENGDESLRKTYNDCIDRMVTFRDHHIEIVETYLTKPLDEQKGTGGTPYGRYLGSFTDDTQNSKLSSPSG